MSHSHGYWIKFCSSLCCFSQLFEMFSTAAPSVFCSRRVWLTPVKTASWRQRSEPPYRRPTMTPRMSRNPPIPPDQTTNQTQSLSLTARGPSQLMGQIVKHRHPMKRKVLPVNTPRPLRPLQPSSVYILIVPLLPTESLHTKKITTVTRKRRAKRTTWSPQLLVLAILRPMQTLGETTVPQ